MPAHHKVWFITGAARGIGAGIVRAALDAGDFVVATARNPDAIPLPRPGEADRLLSLALDVTRPDTVEAAVAAAIERFGVIDVLVNNAGYGLFGAFEELSPEAIRTQFDTNLFGALCVTRAVLPHMRERRSGYILSIASTVGVAGADMASIYAATKFAMVGWSESMSLELARFGIRATAVIAGGFRTDFLDPGSAVHAVSTIPDYAEVGAANRARRDAASHRQDGDPDALGRALVVLAALDEPPARFPAGSFAVGALERAAKEMGRSASDWRALAETTDFGASEPLVAASRHGRNDSGASDIAQEAGKAGQPLPD
ncbi:SDR family oxidoreductase [Rhizosaccharibacter radicis]|uniref:SDR family oxidoreductase n=1 Tax=Rhizosaccharibacter radicis TaxID=2782605 RepID=A0ABT1VZZ7_9PROT|nr:SDR family oxidoreductase [Acetobacteraceae bacterium KSS12]